MIETSVINSYDRILSQINSSIEEYKRLCVDELGVLHSYFLIKHRDNLSFNANRDGIRSEIYVYANAICNAYNIDLKSCNKKLSAVHNKYKNKPEHYEEVNKAIEELMVSLRSKLILPKNILNKNEDYAKVIDKIQGFSHDEISKLIEYLDSKDSNVIDTQHKFVPISNNTNKTQNFNKLVHDICLSFNINLRDKYNLKRLIFEVYNYNSTLHNDGVEMSYKEAYIICDEIKREKNIGVYVGIDEYDRYFVIPLGAQYLNQNYDAYIRTVPTFDDNTEDFKLHVDIMLSTYYNFKYNETPYYKGEYNEQAY